MHTTAPLPLTAQHYTARSLLDELRADGLAHLLGVAQQHVGVALEEHGVVHARVAGGHRALHEHRVLRLPHLR